MNDEESDKLDHIYSNVLRSHGYITIHVNDILELLNKQSIFYFRLRDEVSKIKSGPYKYTELKEEDRKRIIEKLEFIAQNI